MTSANGSIDEGFAFIPERKRFPRTSTLGLDSTLVVKFEPVKTLLRSIKGVNIGRVE